MDVRVVLSVMVPFVLFLLCVVPSVLLAQRRNAELVARSPELLTYGWGYFLGYSGIGGGLFVAIAGLALMVAGYPGIYSDWLPYLALYGIALAIASYGVLTRRRWGWLAHIPLSMNLGMWAFNSVYVSNRWREFPWR